MQKKKLIVATMYHEVMGYIVKPLQRGKIELVLAKFNDTEVLDPNSHLYKK